MSGQGAPKLHIDASGLAVTIVVATWHTEITNGLLAGAERALQEAGNDVYSIMRVPGAFELPLAAKYAIQDGAEVVIALGVVIRGGTPHFEYVCSAATSCPWKRAAVVERSSTWAAEAVRRRRQGSEQVSSAAAASADVR
jgi:6,7-dimethyl-8-ribityllumazine synthase